MLLKETSRGLVLPELAKPYKLQYQFRERTWATNIRIVIKKQRRYWFAKTLRDIEYVWDQHTNNKIRLLFKQLQREGHNL